MKLNLLKDVTIDCQEYKPGAGWSIATDIPDELLDKLMTVEIEWGFVCPLHGCSRFSRTIEVEASYFLDDIIAPIVSEVQNIMETEEDGDYFIDHRYLEVLELDTDTMTVETSFGS